MQQDAKENREALSAQVVREYDKVVELKNELAILEERIRTQSSKIKFKDEHTKKLMKEKLDLEKRCQELSAHHNKTLASTDNHFEQHNSVKVKYKSCTIFFLSYYFFVSIHKTK